MTGKLESRADATRNLEHELGVMIRRVRRAIGTRARLVDPELPSAAYSLLSELYKSGPRRSSELAELFAIDKGAVSRQVGRLISMGFVDRRRDPLDGRAQLLSVTALGSARMDEVGRQRQRSYEERLADWEPEEISALAEQLHRYNKSLD